MKTPLRTPTATLLILLLLSLGSAGAVSGQVSKSSNKSSNAYRAGYQRFASGSISNSTFEIRGGTLWAWGYNYSGQLGDGTTIDKTSPVQIGTDTKWVSIATGGLHTVALKSDGTLWAWGSNGSGQVGDGTNTGRTSPTQVGTDTRWISVACGGYTSIALKSDGTLWTWGDNAYGQMGDGTIVSKNVPTQIGADTKWVSITGGWYTNLAIKSDGTLWGWGRNIGGELGDGSFVQKTSPVQIGTDIKWVSVSSGLEHTLAVKSDGTLWGWGYNAQGQLGNGAGPFNPSPIQVGTETRWLSVACGGNHTVALKSNGTLWTWGYNATYQLGDGTVTQRTSPVQIGTDTRWVGISGGNNHTVALRSDGTLYAFGDNSVSQMGDGTLTPKTVPTALRAAPAEWIVHARGLTHSMGIKSDGTLWAWGDNSAGQLGDGTLAGKLTPIQIGSDNKWVNLVCGSNHTVAIKSDGTLWAWGANGFGELGDGSTTGRTSPVQIGTDNKWVNIAGGRNHTVAIKSDGTLWAWGRNVAGELGDGTTTQRTSPVQIGTDIKWLSIAGGGAHTVALKSDGTLWTWGYNGYGQLGNGGTTDSYAPAQLGTDTKWVAIACGEYHTAARKSDGTLWGWGANSYGEVGNGTATTIWTSPAQVGTDNKWVSVTCGLRHTLALQSDGTLWTWGNNGFGQFGNGTISTQNVNPIQVTAQINVVSLGTSSSGNQSGIVKSTRSQICMAGANSGGQLGDGSTSDASTFNCSNNICASYTLAAGVSTSYTQPLGGAGNRTDFQNNCTLGLSVTASGASPVGGTATAVVLNDASVQSYNGQAYVQRHYDVLPVTSPNTATAIVTLYFTQAEFTAYNAANGPTPDLPAGPSDAAGIANLRVTQFHGTPTGGYAPGNYPATWGGVGPAHLLIDPADADIVWNSRDSRWEVSLAVTGFSGFFVTGALTFPLPVKLLSFTAQKDGEQRHRLEWKTAAETAGCRFEVERSGDGFSYSGIGEAHGKGDASAYRLYDERPLTGFNYYRLKMIEPNGEVSYSSVVVIKNDGQMGGLTIAPLPATQTLTITNTNAGLNGLPAIITDMPGRVVHRFNLEPRLTIDVSTWPAGSYLLKLPGGSALHIVKQ